MAKIKVIIKRPDELVGHVTNISTTLRNLQKTVEGYIETLPLGDNIYLIINEDGKLMRLPMNFKIRQPLLADYIVGTVIVCQIDEHGDIIDLPDDYFGKWKQLLRKWGN